MMIEATAFLAAFLLQIAAVSIFYPARLVRYWHARMAGFSPERLALMYPNVDFNDPKEWQFLARYRVLNIAIAVLGLLLLGGFFLYLRRPGWDDGKITALLTAYFVLQLLVPWAYILWYSVRFNKKHKRVVPEARRKAVLARRGLFDFVSPFAVFLAVAVYVLFVAYVFYIQQHPFPGFAGPLKNIVPVTLVFVLHASIAMKLIYGSKPNPLDTHADRMQMIGFTVKVLLYIWIVSILFLSLNFTLKLLDLESWKPFALSVNFLTVIFFSSMNRIVPPLQTDVDAILPKAVS